MAKTKDGRPWGASHSHPHRLSVAEYERREPLTVCAGLDCGYLCRWVRSDGASNTSDLIIVERRTTAQVVLTVQRIFDGLFRATVPSHSSSDPRQGDVSCPVGDQLVDTCSGPSRER